MKDVWVKYWTGNLHYFGAVGQHVSLLQLVYLYQHYSYMCSHQSYMCMAIGAYECIHMVCSGMISYDSQIVPSHLQCIQNNNTPEYTPLRNTYTAVLSLCTSNANCSTFSYTLDWEATKSLAMCPLPLCQFTYMYRVYKITRKRKFTCRAIVA